MVGLLFPVHGVCSEREIKLNIIVNISENTSIFTSVLMSADSAGNKFGDFGSIHLPTTYSAT